MAMPPVTAAVAAAVLIRTLKARRRRGQTPGPITETEHGNSRRAGSGFDQSRDLFGGGLNAQRPIRALPQNAKT